MRFVTDHAECIEMRKTKRNSLKKIGTMCARMQSSLIYIYTQA